MNSDMMRMWDINFECCLRGVIWCGLILMNIERHHGGFCQAMKSRKDYLQMMLIRGIFNKADEMNWGDGNFNCLKIFGRMGMCMA